MQEVPVDALTLKDTFDVVLRLIGFAGAVLLAIGGMVGFFLKRSWDKRDKAHEEFMVEQQDERNEQVKLREMLFDSLRWFEGDTQKRSVGLAMVSAAWDKDADFRQIWTNVLTTQAIYLLLKSDQKSREDELVNLCRTMEILQRPGAHLDALAASRLSGALARRLRQSTPRGVGPDTEDAQAVELWHKDLANWHGHFSALANPPNPGSQADGDR